MNDPKSALDRLGEKYVSNSFIRTLLQLIPFGAGAAVDTAISTRIDNLREARTRAFFDEIASQSERLPKELLESDDFIHAFSRTFEATCRTHREEKIRIFARLLCAGMGTSEISDIDEFEESLAILDDLSFREWSILVLLEDFESSNSLSKDGNPYERTTSFWRRFCEAATIRLGIRAMELDAAMIRLVRSGCYETFAGVYIDATGGIGQLTPTYYRLSKLVRERAPA